MWVSFARKHSPFSLVFSLHCQAQIASLEMYPKPYPSRTCLPLPLSLIVRPRCLNTSLKIRITARFLLLSVVSKSLSLTSLRPFQGHRRCLLHLYLPLALSTGSYPQLTLESVCWMELLCKEVLPLKDIKEKEQWQLSSRAHNELKSHQLWSKPCPRNFPAAQTWFPGIGGRDGFSKRNNEIGAEAGRKIPAKQGHTHGVHTLSLWTYSRVHLQECTAEGGQEALANAMFCALYMFSVLTPENGFWCCVFVEDWCGVNV